MSEKEKVAAPPRPPRRWRVPATLAGIVLFVLLCGRLLLVRAESGVNEVPLSARPKTVAVTKAKAATYRPTRRYVGTLEPWLQAKIGPQLASGFVDTVLVRPGAVVKRGAVLATLDCRNASAANQAVALQARALSERQKAASKEAARLGEMLTGGFASANEVEQKQAQVAANDAQVQALLAQSSGKALEVGDCVLRAPFDGEVGARWVDPGTFVRPGAGLLQVVDRSIVRLTAEAPEIDFGAIPPKTAAQIRLLATGTILQSEIARRSPAADPATRTIHFEIDLANTTREIPVGTTAEISVEVGEPKPATEIPLLTARVRGSRATIFVVEGGEHGVAKKRSVEVLGERGGSLFVSTDGLPPETLVVTEGRSLLADNDKVDAKLETPNESGEAKR